MGTTQQFTIPKKNVPLNAAEQKDLDYWLDRKEKDLAQNPEGQFANREKAWIAAARAEVARRQNGGTRAAAPAAAAPKQPAALARTSPGQVTAAGAWLDAQKVDTELRKAAETMHLVSPATVCGSLPEGCEVAISLVHVNPSSEKSGPGEVYSVGGGKLGLSGTTLKRIGAAAGVDWDMERSGRLDSGKDPRYCHFRAVGTVRNFDGSIRTLSGEVELDMREGSDQIAAMKARASSEDGFNSQLRDTRLFLMRHAETKAKLRAIADMGLRRSYTAAELEKPFAVARLMATGRTNDPELKREFARMNFDKMTSGRAALYGAPESNLPRLNPPRAAAQHHQQFTGHEPPPVGAVADDGEDLGGYDYDTHGDATSTPLPDGSDEDRGPNPDNY